MKHICAIILLVLLFCQVLTPTIYAGGAKDNYLMLRYETGKIENGDSYSGTYNIFGNNSLEKWALGFRFITGENNFQLIIPCVYYKVGNGWQFGVEYSSDSLGNEKAGPAFRFMGPIGSKVFVFSTGAYYFDFNDDRNMIDLFLRLTNNKKQGWYYGVEAWYYHTKNGTENLHFRPFKIGYKFKNLAPFAAIQRKWNDQGMQADAILTGIEIRF